MGASVEAPGRNVAIDAALSAHSPSGHQKRQAHLPPSSRMIPLSGSSRVISARGWASAVGVSMPDGPIGAPRSCVGSGLAGHLGESQLPTGGQLLPEGEAEAIALSVVQPPHADESVGVLVDAKDLEIG